MRDLNDLNEFRIREKEVVFFGTEGDSGNGIFHINSRIDGHQMLVLAYSGLELDHVSVSKLNRAPLWGDMCLIKDLFFHPEETVMQLHVPQSEWINNLSTCLHLWRPQNLVIPRPPGVMVGVPGLTLR